MQPGEALGITAQIAVTLAGFTGIVVVFARAAAHEWSPADRFRLKLLLTTSVVPLTLSLIGLTLLVAGMYAQLVWGLASALAALLLIGSGAIITRMFWRLSRGDFERAGGNLALFYCASTTGIGVALLQIVNATVLRTFWPFFVCVVFSMVICVIQFVRLVIYQPGAATRAEDA